MSKNNQNLKHRIREQQNTIDALKRDNRELRNILRDLQENKLQTFVDVMLVLFEQFIMCDLSEEQASNLMELMTSVILHSDV